MDLQNTPDYIALYKDNASVSGDNNVYTWNIPNNYFSSARGNKCYVSLAQVIMSSPDSNEVIVKYHGGVNASTSDNNANVLGLMSMSNPHNQNAGHLQFSGSEQINLLINARPSTITISTNNLDNSAYEATDAVFVLKFTYLNPETSNMDYSNTLYQKL